MILFYKNLIIDGILPKITNVSSSTTDRTYKTGDLISIAEVIRDLHRNDEQREQSYSERQLYEAALERLTREVAAVDGVEEEKAQVKVGAVLDGKAA